MEGLEKFKLTREEMGDVFKVKMASPAQIRFVYVLGKKAGYTKDEIEEFNFKRMTAYEIYQLIEDLKVESGDNYEGVGKL